VPIHRCDGLLSGLHQRPPVRCSRRTCLGESNSRRGPASSRGWRCRASAVDSRMTAPSRTSDLTQMGIVTRLVIYKMAFKQIAGRHAPLSWCIVWQPSCWISAPPSRAASSLSSTRSRASALRTRSRGGRGACRRTDARARAAWRQSSVVVGPASGCLLERPMMARALEVRLTTFCGRVG